MTIDSAILAPAIVLVLWSLFMLTWLAASRLPAMASDGFNLQLARAYVGLRIAHSLIQAVWNRVAVRFTLFGAATLALLILAINAALILF